MLGDVASALGAITGVASQARGTYKSLQAKQDLLQALIEDERSRLNVWLSPLESERKYHISPFSGGKSPLDVSLSPQLIV